MTDTIYGRNLQEARRLWSAGADIGGNALTFTAATTNTFRLPLGVPPGVGEYRVIGIHFQADAVPDGGSDAMTANVRVYDESEDAEDTIVDGEDLETLIENAHEWFEATLADEGDEKELTLEPGDSINVQLVNDGTIATNANVAVCIEVIPVPVDDEDHDPDYVEHRSQYVS